MKKRPRSSDKEQPLHPVAPGISQAIRERGDQTDKGNKDRKNKLYVRPSRTNGERSRPDDDDANRFLRGPQRDPEQPRDRGRRQAHPCIKRRPITRHVRIRPAAIAMRTRTILRSCSLLLAMLVLTPQLPNAWAGGVSLSTSCRELKATYRAGACCDVGRVFLWLGLGLLDWLPLGLLAWLRCCRLFRLFLQHNLAGLIKRWLGSTRRRAAGVASSS